MYIIASFKSRNSAVKLYNILRNTGVPAAVISTPKEACTGCGLSVKFDRAHLSKVRDIIISLRPQSFSGYFEVSENNGQRTVRML